MKIRRGFYGLFIALTIVCFAATIAAAIKEDMTCFGLGSFEMLAYLLLAIIVAPRPTTTEEDRKHDDKVQFMGVIALNIVMLAGLALVIWG